jgi:hypothetical protein
VSGLTILALGTSVIEIDQAAYGHPARKRTWLYAFGVDTPLMAAPPAPSGRVVRVYRIRNADGTWRKPPIAAVTSEITHRAAKGTPVQFRDLLIAIVTNGHVGVPAPVAANETPEIVQGPGLHASEHRSVEWKNPAGPTPLKFPA